MYFLHDKIVFSEHYSLTVGIIVCITHCSLWSHNGLWTKANVNMCDIDLRWKLQIVTWIVYEIVQYSWNILFDVLYTTIQYETLDRIVLHCQHRTYQHGPELSCKKYTKKYKQAQYLKYFTQFACGGIFL